jgi:outer membrane protein
MKQLVAICLLALSLALAPSAHASYGAMDVPTMLMAADETKFAFIDVQKIVALSYAGKEAKAKLDGDVLKAEMEKNSREKELNKLKAELDKPSVQLSEPERIGKQKAYEHRLEEYQQFVAKATEDIRVENTELTRGVLEKIFRVVQDYGRKKGFLGIFFKNESMLYLDDKADITGPILQALNAM